MSAARATNIGSLPEETQPRLRALVEHSAPDVDRPRLPSETEKRLDDVERRTAACYADAEERAFRIRRLKQQLDGEGD